MSEQNNATHSLAHTKWNCKYHIVFAPKYRRKVFYGEHREAIREILRTLCQWKGVEIMIILAIESSCDDTCVAILKDKELLSNVVSSQTEFHNKYGGVMPELASRLHVEKISFVINEAVSKANISLNDVDYIAF